MPKVISIISLMHIINNLPYKDTFLQQYNSAKDLINMYDENYEKIKSEVLKLLRIKYALLIVNENPLEIKKRILDFILIPFLFFIFTYFIKIKYIVYLHILNIP